jgi:hypothetical protein
VAWTRKIEQQLKRALLSRIDSAQPAQGQGQKPNACCPVLGGLALFDLINPACEVVDGAVHAIIGSDVVG